MRKTGKEEFLEIYKELESVLSDNGFAWNGSKGPLAQYEDTLSADSEVRRGLQQCRIMRNSYQHENRVLFLPTEDAVKLLKDLVSRLDRRRYAKDEMKKPKKFTLADKPVAASPMADLITKGHTLPVVSDTGEYIGAVNEHVFLLLCLAVVCRGRPGTVQLKTLLREPAIKDAMEKAAEVVQVDTPFSELEEGHVYAVTDKNGKYKGMIER